MGGACNVSFDEQVKVVPIPSLETLLDQIDLKTDLWYSKAEIMAITQEAKDVVRRFEAGKQRASDHLRGLERGTDAGFYQTRKNRHDAYRAISSERLRQEKLGISDAKGLQKAYEPVSSQCAQNAVDVAILDSLHDVAELCPDTNNCSTRWMFTAPANWFGFRKTQPLWQSMSEQMEVSSDESIQPVDYSNILPTCLIRDNEPVAYI